jgi:hypothetical protein
MYPVAPEPMSEYLSSALGFEKNILRDAAD